MDRAGDIALGFSASSSVLDPSVLVVGRVPTDPLGTMEASINLVTGTGVQNDTSHRRCDLQQYGGRPQG
jgi:hypothetical protein